MGEGRRGKSGKHMENKEMQRGPGFFGKSGEMGKIGMGNGWGVSMKCIQGLLCIKIGILSLVERKKP